MMSATIQCFVLLACFFLPTIFGSLDGPSLRNGSILASRKESPGTSAYPQKYLPYLVGLLNRNLASLNAMRDQQEGVKYWKWLGPRMNTIVTGLEKSLVKEPASRVELDPAANNLLEWFIGYGETNRLRDHLNALKLDKKGPSKGQSQIAVNGVIGRLLTESTVGPSSADNAVVKMEVETPRKARSVLPFPARDQSVANDGPKSNAADKKETFFAPRTNSYRAPNVQPEKKLTEGEMLMEIVMNILRLNNIIVDNLKCPVSDSIIRRILKESKPLTAEDVKKFCNLGKSHKRRQAETHISTEAPKIVLEDEDDDFMPTSSPDDIAIEDSENGPLDELLSFGQSFIKLLEGSPDTTSSSTSTTPTTTSATPTTTTTMATTTVREETNQLSIATFPSPDFNAGTADSPVNTQKSSHILEEELGSLHLFENEIDHTTTGKLSPAAHSTEGVKSSNEVTTTVHISTTPFPIPTTVVMEGGIIRESTLAEISASSSDIPSTHSTTNVPETETFKPQISTIPENSSEDLDKVVVTTEILEKSEPSELEGLEIHSSTATHSTSTSSTPTSTVPETATSSRKIPKSFNEENDRLSIGNLFDEDYEEDLDEDEDEGGDMSQSFHEKITGVINTFSEWINPNKNATIPGKLMNTSTDDATEATTETLMRAGSSSFEYEEPEEDFGLVPIGPTLDETEEIGGVKFPTKEKHPETTKVKHPETGSSQSPPKLKDFGRSDMEMDGMDYDMPSPKLLYKKLHKASRTKRPDPTPSPATAPKVQEVEVERERLFEYPVPKTLSSIAPPVTEPGVFVFGQGNPEVNYVPNEEKTTSDVKEHPSVEEPARVEESVFFDENKFHRHVVISIGIMALCGIIAVAALAMIRQAVVSKGHANVGDDVESNKGMITPQKDGARRETYTTPIDDEDEKRNESIELLQKCTRV